MTWDRHIDEAEEVVEKKYQNAMKVWEEAEAAYNAFNGTGLEQPEVYHVHW